METFSRSGAFTPPCAYRTPDGLGNLLAGRHMANTAVQDDPGKATRRVGDEFECTNTRLQSARRPANGATATRYGERKSKGRKIMAFMAEHELSTDTEEPTDDEAASPNAPAPYEAASPTAQAPSILFCTVDIDRIPGLERLKISDPRVSIIAHFHHESRTYLDLVFTGTEQHYLPENKPLPVIIDPYEWELYDSKDIPGSMYRKCCYKRVEADCVVRREVQVMNDGESTYVMYTINYCDSRAASASPSDASGQSAAPHAVAATTPITSAGPPPLQAPPSPAATPALPAAPPAARRKRSARAVHAAADGVEDEEPQRKRWRTGPVRRIAGAAAEAAAAPWEAASAGPSGGAAAATDENLLLFLAHVATEGADLA